MNYCDQDSSEKTLMEDCTEQKEQPNYHHSFQSDVPNVKHLFDSPNTGSNILVTCQDDHQY
jgi:hypothetical protein